MPERKKPRKKRDPKPEHLNLDGDWKNTIGQALTKKKPKDGWPKKKKG